jgi:hypothetical protein
VSLDYIQQIHSMLTEPGEACEFGCNESELEKILPELLLRSKKVRVVKNWTIWRLDVSERDITVLERTGLKNMMIYATIAYDSIDPYAADTYVRSTLLINLRDNCIFETKNTNYVLLDSGTIKTVDVEAVLAVHF